MTTGGGEGHDGGIADRQSVRFLWLYALAWAGGAIAYVPFLTLLLPLRVNAMVAGQAVSVLSYLTVVGAFAASVGGIFFGWASDLTGRRIPWILAGLIISSVALLALSAGTTALQLGTLLVIWQLGLNMMLGPLSALAADFVPDQQKGFLGGLLAFAPAGGAAAGAFVTIPGLAGPEGRFALVAALTAACVLPLILFGKPRAVRLSSKHGIAEGNVERVPVATIRMWIARLAVQLSEAALFAYLLFYFASISSGIGEAETARIFSLLLVASIPVAMVAGRWSDRTDSAIVPLRITAALAAAGLAVMAVSSTVEWSLAGYVIFGLATPVFLALHSSQTLRVLPRSDRRGRDLGVFNLTNTTPSLIVPWLTVAIVPHYGFGPLFWILAGFAGLACLLLISIRSLPKAT